MKRNLMKSVPLFKVFVLLFCLLPQLVAAQPGDPVLFDTDTPIDGGVAILVAVGVAYGIKRFRDERKRQRAS